MLSKILPKGKAYVCPRCQGPLKPRNGPWDMLDCYPCDRSVDLWYLDGELEIMDYEPPLSKEDSVSISFSFPELFDLLNHIYSSNYYKGDWQELGKRIKREIWNNYDYSIGRHKPS